MLRYKTQEGQGARVFNTNAAEKSVDIILKNCVWIKKNIADLRVELSKEIIKKQQAYQHAIEPQKNKLKKTETPEKLLKNWEDTVADAKMIVMSTVDGFDRTAALALIHVHEDAIATYKPKPASQLTNELETPLVEQAQSMNQSSFWCSWWCCDQEFDEASQSEREERQALNHMQM